MHELTVRSWTTNRRIVPVIQLSRGVAQCVRGARLLTTVVFRHCCCVRWVWVDHSISLSVELSLRVKKAALVGDHVSSVVSVSSSTQRQRERVGAVCMSVRADPDHPIAACNGATGGEDKVIMCVCSNGSALALGSV